MRRLLIRPGGIGDCITCFPVMEWLCADYTEIWVPGTVVPLIQFSSRTRSIASTGLDLVGVDGVEIPARLAELLAGFDEIISWYGSNRAEFRDVARELNANWRFLPAFPPKGAKQQVTDFHATQVGAPTGMIPRIHVNPTPARESIVIHPFSGGRVKNWPLANFRELAKTLPFPVEWTAGPEEDLPEACRFENLLDLAEWISGALLYIGNDSGITHLAAATGAPTIGLYSAANAPVWGARGNLVRHVLKPSLEEIRVEDVITEAEFLLPRHSV
jgi:ADP-heptose:LPS heptosyltransferase